MIQVLGKKKVLNMENNKMNNIENLDEQKQKNNATQQTTNLNLKMKIYTSLEMEQERQEISLLQQQQD